MKSKTLRGVAALTVLFITPSPSGAADNIAASSAIERLQNLKRDNQRHLSESKLRQEFLDRLIFQIDTKFKGGSMHAFLRETLKVMAQQQPASPMYDFLMKASDLMEYREPGDDGLSLLQRYLHAGGILHPIPVKEFLARQSYLNSDRSEYVSGQNIEDIDLSAASGADDRPLLKTVEIRE